jgi:hypothetical protein
VVEVRLLLLLAALATPSGGPPSPLPIEKCDGSGQAFFGSTHADGEEWFSMKGRVVDAAGNPVCGARVTAEYADVLETKWGVIGGPSSPTGKNGEFFLANLKKGVSFRVRVNPYAAVERLGASDPGSLDSFVKSQQNVRTAGVARYTSENLKSTEATGLMTFDIELEDDPRATGILVGNVRVPSPYDVNAPAVARVVISSGEAIEASVHRRNGEFVMFGLPPGQYRVDVEVSVNGRRLSISGATKVPSGKNAVATIDLLEK